MKVPIFHVGEHVMLRFQNQERNGAVVMASSNGRSLFLQFDGMLGGYCGSIACLWDDQRRTFVDLIDRKSVGVWRANP